MNEDGDEIVAVARRGDGVTASGHHVALAAPGDRLLADGSLVPGLHHAQPPCRHFPTCGGCTLQHLDDESYARFLIDGITGALRAQGLSAPIEPPHLSPPRTRRRTTLKAERRGRAVLIGFHETASHRIVDMRECHILEPALFALVEPLRRLLGRLLGDRRSGEVAMTLIDGGVDLLLRGVTADDLVSAEAITSFAAEHGLARLSLDDGFGAQPRWEPKPATITLGGAAVPFPAGGFLQATADGEATLVSAVKVAIGAAATVLDLFAGLGTFALALPGRVLAAEGARDAALALKDAAARSGRSVLVDHRDLFRRPYASPELARFDAVVLDPPRAGAREQMPALAASGVKRIAYVSCNPGTFARDAKVLIDGGYTLAGIKPVGQFRWSTHVELAARFTRP